MNAAINIILTLTSCFLAACVAILMFHGKFFTAAFLLLLIGVNCATQHAIHKMCAKIREKAK